MLYNPIMIKHLAIAFTLFSRIKGKGSLKNLLLPFCHTFLTDWPTVYLRDGFLIDNKFSVQIIFNY